MGVHMDHADGPVGRDGAEDRQRDQMIAADRERRGAGGMNLGEELLDPLQAVHQVDGIDRRVAQIGDAAELIGRDPADMVDLADEARHVPHFARPVAGAGPVGGAAVPGHADEGDVELGRVGDMGQAHEGAGPRSAA